MKSPVLASIAILLSAAVSSTALADGRKPGSMLTFPVHRSGPGKFTIVSVTNTNTTPATPVSLGGSTNLHFEYYNVVPDMVQGYDGLVAGNPFVPAGCIVFDRVEFVTPADTLSVLTSCHNPTFPGGQEGYVVVTAQNPAVYDQNWSFNRLIGSACVINASGTMYSVNAFSSRSVFVEGAPIADGQGLTKLQTGAYELLPRVLMIDSFMALNASQLALISATPQDHYLRDIYLSVWNDNEFPMSATLQFRCWFDQPLTRVSPLFSESFLLSTSHDPSELDINCDGIGDIETGWATIRTRRISLPGGQSVDQGDLGMIGAITAGNSTVVEGGRLLWEARIPI
ncbi:MAG: hypothetical protein KDB80_07695 [Planctomycetes bacterium]|nr:hypothetical protein [Planctomycetota bacterium]